MHWLVSQRASQKLMRAVELFSTMDYSTTLEKHSKNNPKRSILAKCKKLCRWKALERELLNYSFITAAKARAQGSEMESSTCFWPFVMIASRCPTTMLPQFLNAQKLGWNWSNFWSSLVEKLVQKLSSFSSQRCVLRAQDGNWEDHLPS